MFLRFCGVSMDATSGAQLYRPVVVRDTILMRDRERDADEREGDTKLRETHMNYEGIERRNGERRRWGGGGGNIRS